MEDAADEGALKELVRALRPVRAEGEGDEGRVETRAAGRWAGWISDDLAASDRLRRQRDSQPSIGRRSRGDYREEDVGREARKGGQVA